MITTITLITLSREVINFENVMNERWYCKVDHSALIMVSASFSYVSRLRLDNANSTTDTSTLTLFGILQQRHLPLTGATLTANLMEIMTLKSPVIRTFLFENLNVLSITHCLT